ncbi:MAG: sugar phosphate nucleotidyltransferase [Anaeromyxobacter sp.]
MDRGGEPVGMILCAGLGTRLRPLTDALPKPAIPVAGLPLVRWSLALLAGAGVRRAAVNVHHLPDRMAEAAVAAGRAVGVEVSVSKEPVIAGTGGALREARGLLAGASELVVVNGDVLFDVNLAAALAAHREAARAGALATMLLLPMPPGAKFATVDVDADGAVRRIAGRGAPPEVKLAPWHFSGVHVLSPGLLEQVPAEPHECDVNRHVYPPLFDAGAVRGLVVSGYWNDLGTPGRYLEATADLLAGRVPLKRFRGADPWPGCELAPGAEPSARICAGKGTKIDPAARLHGPVIVGDGAEIDCGAEVGPASVIGAGARIGAGACVRRAIVWPGTVVKPGEHVEGAIAAGGERVKG